MRIFVKKCEIGNFFDEFWKTKLKHFVEKSLSVLKGPNLKPFKHTKTFFPRKMFFFFSFNIHAFYNNLRFFHKHMKLLKKCDWKIFKLRRYNKVLSNVGGNALFWRGH